MASRRDFIKGAALAGLATQLPLGFAGSSVPVADRKFIFVTCNGGWDVTPVFATCHDNPNVDMEAMTDVGQFGDLRFVDHPNRPTVRTFFERNHQQALILNGLMVPSVAHESCRRLVMTGTTADSASDWPAILASAGAGDYPLPHLVLAGPSYPGPLGTVVTRTGGSGQLEGLLSGEILERSEIPVRPLDYRSEDLVDRYLQRRAQAELLSAGSAEQERLLAAYDQSLERGLNLKALKDDVDWGAGTLFGQQIKVGVAALSLGISRCITMKFKENTWDTHQDNMVLQSENFASLFNYLLVLMDTLAVNPGTSAGATLADETLVVVLSEMGRTPQLNSEAGRDHWPCTSMLLVGPGVAGGRVIGEYDDFFYGGPIDATSGESSSDGMFMTSANVGASLIQLADVDPEEFLPGVASIPGILDV
jgi:uncharacterized protein (DUF1501 family)